jgi:hypothetical protein
MIQLAIIDFNPESTSILKNKGQCGLDGNYPGGGHGFRRQLRGGGMTEEYNPFATPDAMLEPCSCFAPNGTYTCVTTADNGHHMEPGAGCSFDILAGGMWLQRQKQYLLANGVAVMTVNARTFDGWNIDNETYDGHRVPDPNSNPYESVTEGTDKPFFAALARDMASGKLGQLNPARVAFHGWSGGAQMVSELVDVFARGELTGITMKAGVMMSGGTQQCYNTPLGTPGREAGSPASIAQCAACDGGYQCNTPGCSADPPVPPQASCLEALQKDCGSTKSKGYSACQHCLSNNSNALEGAGCMPTVAEDFCAGKDPRNQTVCCNMCCPQGTTESFYLQHPEEYAKHPAMFLGQVSHDDNEADGCAAQCEWSCRCRCRCCSHRRRRCCCSTHTRTPMREHNDPNLSVLGASLLPVLICYSLL